MRRCTSFFRCAPIRGSLSPLGDCNSAYQIPYSSRGLDGGGKQRGGEGGGGGERWVLRRAVNAMATRFGANQPSHHCHHAILLALFRPERAHVFPAPSAGRPSATPRTRRGTRLRASVSLRARPCAGVSQVVIQKTIENSGL